MARIKERTFGQVIRERSRQLDLTQEEVAHRIKTSTPYVGHLESGKRHPSDKIVTRLAEVLGLDRRELFFLANPRAQALLTPEVAETAESAWEDFRKNEQLRRLHNVTGGEMEMLSRVALLGDVRSPARFHLHPEYRAARCRQVTGSTLRKSDRSLRTRWHCRRVFFLRSAQPKLDPIMGEPARARDTRARNSAMAAAIHGRRAVFSRHRALLHRPHQHLGRDNPDRAPIRLRLRRPGTRAIRRLLGISVDAADRRMDGRSVRRASRARRRCRDLVDRNFRYATCRRRDIFRPARRARAARPGRGRELPVDSQPHRALDAAEERSRVLSVNYSGIHVGTVVALSASPLIIIAFGWPALFYIAGAIGLVWVAVWLYVAADRPETSSRITVAELRSITSGRSAEPTAVRVPWAANRARESRVGDRRRALCTNFGFYILLLWLPTYLHTPSRGAGTRRRCFRSFHGSRPSFPATSSDGSQTGCIARGLRVVTCARRCKRCHSSAARSRCCWYPSAYSTPVGSRHC